MTMRTLHSGVLALVLLISLPAVAGAHANGNVPAPPSGAGLEEANPPRPLEGNGIASSTAAFLGTAADALPGAAPGNDLSEDTVRAAVQTWVRLVTADARPDAIVERMEPYVVGGETRAYVVHLRGGGFCLAGAHATSLPVYLYSPHGWYDPDNPDYRFILDEIAAADRIQGEGVSSVSAEQPARDSELRKRGTMWQSLVAGRIPPRDQGLTSPQTVPSGIALALSSKWGQRSPYNDACPLLKPGTRRVPTGCNATAAAQIMSYWQWPPAGDGSACAETLTYRYSATWLSTHLATSPGTIPEGLIGRLRFVDDADPAKRQLQMTDAWDDSTLDQAEAISGAPDYQTALSTLWNMMTTETDLPCATFAGTTYDWSIMPATHATPPPPLPPPDAGDVEVAKMFKHVAIGIRSAFHVEGTNGSFSVTVPGLKNYFRYDDDALFTDTGCQGHPGGASPHTIVEEIQWLRPVGLGGTSSGGSGHAWVVYGYRDAPTGMEFLMNMGWDGSENAWYTLDNVATSGFNFCHDMMSQIAPQDAVRFVGGGTPGADGSPADPYSGIEAALADAPDGTTLIFKAASDNTFAASSLTIDRPLVLRGVDATIRQASAP